MTLTVSPCAFAHFCAMLFTSRSCGPPVHDHTVMVWPVGILDEVPFDDELPDGELEPAPHPATKPPIVANAATPTIVPCHLFIEPHPPFCSTHHHLQTAYFVLHKRLHTCQPPHPNLQQRVGTRKSTCAISVVLCKRLYRLYFSFEVDARYLLEQFKDEFEAVNALIK